FAIVDEAIDVLARKLPHHGLVLPQSVGRERLHQQAAPRHMSRFVLVHQSPVHCITIGGKSPVGFVAYRRDLLECDRGTERDVVAKNGLALVVARDDPITEFRAEKNRLFVTRPPEVLGWVLLVAVLEWIELRRARAHRTAARRGLDGLRDRACPGAG